MNKTDLVNLIAEKSNLTKKDSSTILDAFIESVEETLAKGEKIQLVGFGSFLVAERAERIGRNPRTKEEIKIPASTVPKFVAGKEFKEKVSK
jgi:DNA-binding protein HU-beta